MSGPIRLIPPNRLAAECNRLHPVSSVRCDAKNGLSVNEVSPPVLLRVLPHRHPRGGTKDAPSWPQLLSILLGLVAALKDVVGLLLPLVDSKVLGQDYEISDT